VGAFLLRSLLFFRVRCPDVLPLPPLLPSGAGFFIFSGGGSFYKNFPAPILIKNSRRQKIVIRAREKKIVIRARRQETFFTTP